VDRSRRILEALGREGTERVLRSAFGHPALVRAANACRLTYPGTRTQAIDDTRLASDLAQKALDEPDAGLILVKSLEKACAAEIKIVESISAPALAKAGSPVPASARAAGRLLLALAVDPRKEARVATTRLLVQLEGPEPPAVASRPARRQSLTRDNRAPIIPDTHHETLAAAQSEASRAAQRAEAAEAELLASRKHAHSLDVKAQRLAEECVRLRERELLLSGRLEEMEKGAPGGAALSRIATELHHSLRANEKQLHEIREIIATRLAATPDPARPYLEALAATVRSVQTEIGDLRSEREADRRKEREALSEISRVLQALRAEMPVVSAAAAAERPIRRKGEPQRVGLFVDVQNMYYAARQLNAKLDFGALIDTVSRERRLIRAIAYVVQNRDIDQTGFLAMLQQRNYEVKRMDLRVRADGSAKGDWDMGIALDILDLVDSVDVVVLASGDGDFVPLVNRVKARGPRVEVYSFSGSTAKELIESCDHHVTIDDALLKRPGMGP